MKNTAKSTVNASQKRDTFTNSSTKGSKNNNSTSTKTTKSGSNTNKPQNNNTTKKGSSQNKPNRDTFTYSSNSQVTKQTNKTSSSSERNTYSCPAQMDSLTPIKRKDDTKDKKLPQNNNTQKSNKNNNTKKLSDVAIKGANTGVNTANNKQNKDSKKQELTSLKQHYDHTTDPKQKNEMKKTINAIAYESNSKEKNIMPVSLQDGYISADYGHTDKNYHQKGHKGVDIAAPAGTPIKSSISGEVVGVFDNNTQGYRGYGNSVLVKGKDDMYYFYAHMNNVNVQAGDKVKGGDVLGGVGSTGNSTGNHLHFEIRTGEEWNSPKVNPHDYIDY